MSGEPIDIGDIEEYLKCVVCFELCIKVKILPCMHMICVKCVEELHGRDGEEDNDKLNCGVCECPFSTTVLKERHENQFLKNVIVGMIVVKSPDELCGDCDKRDDPGKSTNRKSHNLAGKSDLQSTLTTQNSSDSSDSSKVLHHGSALDKDLNTDKPSSVTAAVTRDDFTFRSKYTSSPFQYSPSRENPNRNSLSPSKYEPESPGAKSDTSSDSIVSLSNTIEVRNQSLEVPMASNTFEFESHTMEAPVDSPLSPLNSQSFGAPTNSSPSHSSTLQLGNQFIESSQESSCAEYESDSKCQPTEAPPKVPNLTSLQHATLFDTTSAKDDDNDQKNGISDLNASSSGQKTSELERRSLRTTPKTDEYDCQPNANTPPIDETECQARDDVPKKDPAESQPEAVVPTIIESKCQSETDILYTDESECHQQADVSPTNESDCQSKSDLPSTDESDSHSEADAPLSNEPDNQPKAVVITLNDVECLQMVVPRQMRATSFCCNCSRGMCYSCAAEHPNTPTSKDHYVWVTSEPLNIMELVKSVYIKNTKCYKNHGMSLQMYCHKCNLRFCGSCEKHKGHMKEKISDMKNECAELASDSALFDEVLQKVDQLRRKSLTGEIYGAVEQSAASQSSQPTNRNEGSKQSRGKGKSKSRNKNVKSELPKNEEEIETAARKDKIGSLTPENEFQHPLSKPLEPNSEMDNPEHQEDPSGEEQSIGDKRLALLLERWRQYKMRFDNISFLCKMLIQFGQPDSVADFGRFFKDQLKELIGYLPEQDSAEFLEKNRKLLDSDEEPPSATVRKCSIKVPTFP